MMEQRCRVCGERAQIIVTFSPIVPVGRRPVRTALCEDCITIVREALDARYYETIGAS